MTRRKRSNGDGSLFYSQAQSTWVGEVLLPNGKKKRKKTNFKE